MDVKEGKLKEFYTIKTWVILSIGIFLFGCATTKDVQILDMEIDKLVEKPIKGI